MTPQLILASASPRRARILREHGYRFTVMTSPLAEPEGAIERLTPAGFAEAVSHYKAQSVAAMLEAGVVLGADTVVALAGHLFGKPADAADAERILRALSGTTHEVITGVTVLDAATGDRVIAHDVTRVQMRELSEDALAAYLASGNWQGKAGAYGIQDSGDPFVACLEGSFANVVGLPIERTAPLLAGFGVVPDATAEQTADGDPQAE